MIAVRLTAALLGMMTLLLVGGWGVSAMLPITARQGTALVMVLMWAAWLAFLIDHKDYGVGTDGGERLLVQIVFVIWSTAAIFFAPVVFG